MRKYKFKPGDVVRLQLMEHYRAIGLPYWSWLQIEKIVGRDAICKHKHANELSGEYKVRLWDISPPPGFQETYEVHQDAGKISDIIRKMAKWVRTGGVRVWSSHDLSRAGDYVYTPSFEQQPPRSDVRQVELVDDLSVFEFYAWHERGDKPTSREKKELGWVYDRKLKIWTRSEKVDVSKVLGPKKKTASVKFYVRRGSSEQASGLSDLELFYGEVSTNVVLCTDNMELIQLSDAGRHRLAPVVLDLDAEAADEMLDCEVVRYRHPVLVVYFQGRLYEYTLHAPLMMYNVGAARLGRSG